MTPLIGEIRLFGGNFAPRGWAFCEGQFLSIAQNTALFSIFGTTYGGDGRTTFALPDLRGKTAIGIADEHDAAVARGDAAIDGLAAAGVLIAGYQPECRMRSLQLSCQLRGVVCRAVIGDENAERPAVGQSLRGYDFHRLADIGGRVVRGNHNIDGFLHTAVGGPSGLMESA